MNKTRNIWGLLALLVVCGLVVSTLAVGPALAGKGGNKEGGKGRVRPMGTEHCWVQPDPVSPGQRYTIFGTGFYPDQTYVVFVAGNLIMFAGSDGTGTFTTADWYRFTEPGTYPVDVYMMGDRHKTLLANCSLRAN